MLLVSTCWAVSHTVSALTSMTTLRHRNGGERERGKREAWIIDGNTDCHKRAEEIQWKLKCEHSLVMIPPAGVQTPVWEFTAVLNVRRKHDAVNIRHLSSLGCCLSLCLSHTHLPKLPVTGYADTKEPMMLVTPIASSSWLASIL